jgi:putative oxidoreductase
MRHIPTIVGGLLGLAFIASAGAYFFKLIPDQTAPPEGSPMALFFGAFVPTHYLDVVKALELLGGVLLAIPKTRNLGLLILGPILINILLFHGLVAKEGLLNPVLLVLTAAMLFLLIVERKAFWGLVRR